MKSDDPLFTDKTLLSGDPLSTDSLLNAPQQPSLPQEEPRTPMLPRAFLPLVHPSSEPHASSTILPQTFHSSPENASDGATTLESPSKVLSRIHGSLPQRLSWHPHPRSRQLLEMKNDMWPILDTQIRQTLNSFRPLLREHLRRLPIGDFGIMLAMYGHSRATAQPSFIVLSSERFSATMIPGIPNQFRIVSLRYTHKQGSQDVLLKEYTERPFPGLAIGAADRPHTSFSLGWWVRDCGSGSVFNLTCAHSLREPQREEPHAWSRNDELGSPQVVDCPPHPLIEETTVQLKREIQELVDSQGNVNAAIEDKCKHLREIELCRRNKEFAMVVAAGYGEYPVEENGEQVFLAEDWALLRAKSRRIGKNEFPAVDGFSAIRYSSMGEIEYGVKVNMNGAVSGRTEGVIMDCIDSTLDEHDNETRNWVVREKRWGIFSSDGDSGSAIGLEGGRAGGILLGGGIGVDDDDGSQFPFSYIAPLSTIFARIEQVTGRKLEIPDVYDLSHRSTRDHYHRVKTGKARISER